MDKQKATDFFSEFYGGEHHIPGFKLHEWGFGWMVKHDRGPFATYDFNELTRLVLMAHRDCIRVEISAHTMNMVKICISQREPEGTRIDNKHPNIYSAIKNFNHHYNK